MYSGLSDSNSEQAGRCVGDVTAETQRDYEGLQGWGPLEAHHGIELVAFAVYMVAL